MCLCASVHVCMRAFVGETEPVCSVRITQVVSHCCPVTHTLWNRERKHKKRTRTSAGVSVPCPVGAHSSGLRVNRKSIITDWILHFMNMDFHQKFLAQLHFLSFFVSLFVCCSIPPAPFSISSVCGEWNDLSAAATFRPGRAHAVKNKTYSHELTPKPVTTGSNHRFITTAKREKEREGRDKRQTQEDEAIGGDTATKWDTERKVMKL